MRSALVHVTLVLLTASGCGDDDGGARPADAAGARDAIALDAAGRDSATDARANDAPSPADGATAEDSAARDATAPTDAGPGDDAGACVPEDGMCVADEQCCGGLCDGVVCHEWPACVVEPDSCDALHAPCCSGRECGSAGGVLRCCTGLRGECVTDDDCCSGTCGGGICRRGLGTSGCVGGGFICDDDTTCCNGICTVPEARCGGLGTAELGEPCDSGADCTSGHCYDRACSACASGGAACAGAADCCNGRCEADRCSYCRPLGSVCEHPRQCCEGTCIRAGIFGTCEPASG